MGFESFQNYLARPDAHALPTSGPQSRVLDMNSHHPLIQILSPASLLLHLAVTTKCPWCSLQHFPSSMPPLMLLPRPGIASLEVLRGSKSSKSMFFQGPIADLGRGVVLIVCTSLLALVCVCVCVCPSPIPSFASLTPSIMCCLCVQLVKNALNWIK